MGVQVPLNTSQIAERTGLTRTAVSNALGDLAAAGVVSGFTSGPTKVHSLDRRNAYTELLVTPLFEGEAEIPELMLDELRSAFEDLAKSVVVFGSYARGDQTPESDVDVILVAKDAKTKPSLEARADQYSTEFLARFGAPLSPLVYDPSDAARLVETSPDLAQALLREAIVACGSHPWSRSDG